MAIVDVIYICLMFSSESANDNAGAKLQVS